MCLLPCAQVALAANIGLRTMRGKKKRDEAVADGESKKADMEKKYKKLKVVSYCQLPMCQYRVGLTEPRLRPLNRRPGGFPEDPVGGEGPAENRCCSLPVARMQRRLVFTCVYVACTCAMLSASQGVRLTSLSGLSKRRCPQHRSCPTTRRRSWRALYFALRLWPTPWSPTRVTCFMYDCTCCAVLCCVFASIESDLASKTVAQLKEMLACVGKRCRELRGWAAPRIRT